MLTTCYRREPCADTREGIGEVSVAVRIAMMIEHRKRRCTECRGCQRGRRQYRLYCNGEVQLSSAVSKELMDVRKQALCRDLGEVYLSLTVVSRTRKERRYSEFEDERDKPVGCRHSTDDSGEQRGASLGGVERGKGCNQRKSAKPKHVTHTGWERVSQAVERIRQAVKRNPKEKLTALLHHISVDTLCYN